MKHKQNKSKPEWPFQIAALYENSQATKIPDSF